MMKHFHRTPSEALHEHIRAVGPIALFDILGWLEDQYDMTTFRQLGLFAGLARDHKIEPYDRDDMSLGWIAK